MKKVLLFFTLFILIIVSLMADIDVGGYIVRQYNSTQTFTIPANTIIPDNGYLIIGRDATQTEFETFWGIALNSNVVYINSAGTFPYINGDEYFTLHDASDVLIDSTSDSISSGYSLQRDSTNINTFTSVTDANANPGTGANGGHNAKLVINEYSDASGSGNYVYEFIEIYYDTAAATGNLPPAIGSLQNTPEYVFAGDSVLITANISDDSSVDSDTLFYKINSGTWSSMSHDSISSITYYYNIGTFNANDTISYFIKAIDDSSAETISDTNNFIVIDTIYGVIDLNGYTIYQHNAELSYTLSNVRMPGHGYLIVSRYSSKSDFETFWGVNLANNVIFVNSQGAMPQINGGELFSLYNASSIIVDSTMDTLIVANTVQRDSTNVDTWTQSSETNANPGAGITKNFNRGLKITEYSDASTTGDYIYEFIELYYDNDGSGANTPPYFSNTGKTPTLPQPSENVNVYIDITDDSGISTDSMYYRVNAGTWSRVYHDSLNSYTYYFTIPGQADNDYVEYYFIAIDDSSAKSISDTFNYTVRLNSGAGYKILFDYTKDQRAGNADWVIDLNYPVPSPTSPTAETDWDGAISYWGYELDTFGYECQTLPPGSSITYGTANTMDLSNFNVYIVCEPQNQFTLSEKQAIFDFVRNGGGLFMVSDHNSSDRNSSGWDSPRIWNDLGSKDSFGIHFDTTGESYNSTSDTAVSFIGNDSIYNGIFGDATGGQFIYHLGTTMPSTAQAIEIAPHPSSSSYSMFSIAYFGNGKVAGMGDSSPSDDGTGDPGDALYDGWTEGVSRILILNATWWLSGVGTYLNEINYSLEFDNNSVIINLSFSNYQSYNSIRLYKKEFNGKKYNYISTYKSDKHLTFKDDISNNTQKVFYKITGIDRAGNEKLLKLITVNIPNNDIKLKNEIVFSNTLMIENLRNNTSYIISDKSGRIIKKGITHGEINLKNISAGIYFISLDKTKIYKFIYIK